MITDIFKSMKMKIRKWASNSSKVLATIPKEDLYPYETKQLIDPEEDLEKEMNFSESLISKATKILGMALDTKKMNFKSIFCRSKLGQKVASWFEPYIVTPNET